MLWFYQGEEIQVKIKKDLKKRLFGKKVRNQR